MKRPQAPALETPRPRGVAGSYGPQAIHWARERLGLTLDHWQQYALTQMLRHDKDGNLIHRVALISTARQNGKSVIVRVLFGWILNEGHGLPPFASWTTMLAAAHDAKQARIIYGGVLGDMLSIPDLRDHMKGRYAPVRLTEFRGIEMWGLTLDTVTSQPGSARGLSAGAIAWDEMLTQRDWEMWEALSPTQSAQRSPIMVLTSTAGREDSLVLRSFYDRLTRISSGDEPPDPAFYGVWWQSQRPDAGLDWKEIRRANPSMDGGRLARAAIQAEFRTLPADSWARERLNHFVDSEVQGALRPGIWAACRTTGPLSGADGPFVLGVDIQPGWERATVTVAGRRSDGRIGVEVYRSLSQDVTAERLISIIDSFPDPVSAVIYDSVSGAASAFGRHGYDAWGTDWVALKPSEVVAASMDVTEMIQSGTLAHDDPVLDQQVPVVGRRDVGREGGFRFSRSASPGPIDAFMSMTFAAHHVASGTGYPKVS